MRQIADVIIEQSFTCKGHTCIMWICKLSVSKLLATTVGSTWGHIEE